MSGIKEDGLIWETTTMCLSFNEDSNILFVHPHQGFKGKETLDHAKENVENTLKKVGDKLTGIVAEMPHHYISAELTRYYKQHIPDVPIAMIAHSFFQKMIGNFLLSLASQNRPTKLFTSEEEALTWLNDQIG